MQDRRGSIINRERAKQIRDFSGLRFGNITPTDIDGLIEYHNKTYVLFELKYLDGELPYGQKLALERITDDLERSGKPTLCIFASHNTHDPNEDIDCANAFVTEYRLKGKWYELGTDLITVKEIIDLFLNNFETEAHVFYYLCLRYVRSPNKMNLTRFMR